MQLKGKGTILHTVDGAIQKIVGIVPKAEGAMLPALPEPLRTDVEEIIVATKARTKNSGDDPNNTLTKILWQHHAPDNKVFDIIAEFFRTAKEKDFFSDHFPFRNWEPIVDAIRARPQHPWHVKFLSVCRTINIIEATAHNIMPLTKVDRLGGVAKQLGSALGPLFAVMLHQYGSNDVRHILKEHPYKEKEGTDVANDFPALVSGLTEGDNGRAWVNRILGDPDGRQAVEIFLKAVKPIELKRKELSEGLVKGWRERVVGLREELTMKAAPLNQLLTEVGTVELAQERGLPPATDQERPGGTGNLVRMVKALEARVKYLSDQLPPIVLDDPMSLQAGSAEPMWSSQSLIDRDGKLKKAVESWRKAMVAVSPLTRGEDDASIATCLDAILGEEENVAGGDEGTLKNRKGGKLLDALITLEDIFAGALKAEEKLQAQNRRMLKLKQKTSLPGQDLEVDRGSTSAPPRPPQQRAYTSGDEYLYNNEVVRFKEMGGGEVCTVTRPGLNGDIDVDVEGVFLVNLKPKPYAAPATLETENGANTQGTRATRAFAFRAATVPL